MKLKDRIKFGIINIGKGFKRFPMTIGTSILLIILLIYFNEFSGQMNLEQREMITRINMVVGLGIILTLNLTLLKERFFPENKPKIIATYLVGVILLISYYLLGLKEINTLNISRYLGTCIFLIILVFYIAKIKKDEGYENYVIEIVSNYYLTIIYSIVLYGGISIILLTINQLFDINIKSKVYYYMFLGVALGFAISLFLSKFPGEEDEFREAKYPQPLKVLLIYIVVPLITIYTIILYIYFLKILITRQWPKGLVSHLVLWYTTLTVGIIFFIKPVKNENSMGRVFSTWFPKIVLPILLMMFVSIGIRIRQYGITENRYYVLVLGFWVSGIMIYFSVKKLLKNIIIPISLSLVILNSLYGPLSSFSISKYSQNKRFENILLENQMIQNGNIVKNNNISAEDKREINNILSYFEFNHSLKDIKYFSETTDMEDIEEILGFSYTSYDPYYREVEYFYFNIDNNILMDIKGYDHYILISHWNRLNELIDDINLSYDEGYILKLSKDNTIIFTQDMKEIGKEIYDRNKKRNTKNQLSLEEMTVLKEVEDLKLKFIINNIGGKINKKNDIVEIENIEFILLIGKK